MTGLGVVGGLAARGTQADQAALRADESAMERGAASGGSRRYRDGFPGWDRLPEHYASVDVRRLIGPANRADE
jgi:hypothetical protein